MRTLTTHFSGWDFHRLTETSLAFCLRHSFNNKEVRKYDVAVDVRMRVSAKCSSIPFPWMSVNTCQMTELSDTQQLIRLIVRTFRSEDKRYELLNDTSLSQVIL